MTEALTHASVALQRLQRPDMSPGEAEAWQEGRTVITKAKALYRTALAANIAHALYLAHHHLEEAMTREGAEAAATKALASLRTFKVDLREAVQRLRAAEESETAPQDGSAARQ